MDNHFQIEYIKINRENAENCLDFMNLGYDYMNEVASEKSLEFHNKFLNSILNRQSENERWLPLYNTNS